MVHGGRRAAGTLDYHELYNLFERYGENVTAEELQRVGPAVDTRGAGAIDYLDFRALMDEPPSPGSGSAGPGFAVGAAELSARERQFLEIRRKTRSARASPQVLRRPIRFFPASWPARACPPRVCGARSCWVLAPPWSLMLGVGPTLVAHAGCWPHLGRSARRVRMVRTACVLHGDTAALCRPCAP